jgi:hypothetical protein
MKLLFALALTVVVNLCPLFAQGRPDAGVQKTAMQKLKFLAGKWQGEAMVTTPEGTRVTLVQTEEVTYKLDGLLLVIEGTGRDETGKVVFNALAVVSYDPGTSTYRIRAWNAGQSVETELKVEDKAFEWSFPAGPVTVRNRMTVDKEGKWAEVSEATHQGRKLHGTKMLLSRE